MPADFLDIVLYINQAGHSMQRKRDIQRPAGFTDDQTGTQMPGKGTTCDVARYWKKSGLEKWPEFAIWGM